MERPTKAYPPSAQPLANTAITTQPTDAAASPFTLAEKDWCANFWDVSDLGLLALSCCCPCVVQASIGEDVGSSYALCCLTSFCTLATCLFPCHCIAGGLLRERVRRRYRIRGNVLCDLCAYTCCYPCALSQAAIQTEYEKELRNANDSSRFSIRLGQRQFFIGGSTNCQQNAPRFSQASDSLLATQSANTNVNNVTEQAHPPPTYTSLQQQPSQDVPQSPSRPAPPTINIQPCTPPEKSKSVQFTNTLFEPTAVPVVCSQLSARGSVGNQNNYPVVVPPDFPPRESFPSISGVIAPSMLALNDDINTTHLDSVELGLEQPLTRTVVPSVRADMDPDRNEPDQEDKCSPAPAPKTSQNQPPQNLPDEVENRPDKVDSDKENDPTTQ